MSRALEIGHGSHPVSHPEDDSGLCHGQRGNLDLAWTRCPRGPPCRCSLRPQSQPAAQLRPEKLQRSARERSDSTKTRTLPMPMTATFLTHQLTNAPENSRQQRVRGGEKSVTRADHAAAITTTSARSMNRRPVIPVAPRVHRGGLPSDVEEIPQAAGYDGARESPAAWPRRYRKRQDAEEVVSAATAPGPSRLSGSGW